MQTQAISLTREQKLANAYAMENYLLARLLSNRIAKKPIVRSTALELARSLYKSEGIKSVKDLQRFLNSTIDARLELDGIFGKETLKALVMKLQKDSIISKRGNKFAKALQVLRAHIYRNFSTSKTVNELSFFSSEIIDRTGMNSVVALQKSLRSKNYLDYAGRKLAVDGYLGKRTLSAYLSSLENVELRVRAKAVASKDRIMRTVPVRPRIVYAGNVLPYVKGGKTRHYAYLDKVQSSSFISAINPSLVLRIGSYDDLTDGFRAYRSHPEKRMFKRHTGVDVHTGNKNIAVRVPVDCEVVQASKTEHPTMGYYLKVKAKVDNRIVYMTFMHLNAPSELNKGDRLKKGQIIGKTGKTGNARHEDNQIHFEMYTYAAIPKYGRVRFYIDPTPIMLAGDITRTKHKRA